MATCERTSKGVPTPRTSMKVYVESTRAVSLAAHSSGSLLLSASKQLPRRRLRFLEAARLMRQSEALARMAASLVLAPDGDAPSPGAEAATPAAVSAPRRRRRRRRQRFQSMHPQRFQTRRERPVAIKKSIQVGCTGTSTFLNQRRPVARQHCVTTLILGYEN